MSTTSSNHDYSQRTRAREWLKAFNAAAHTAVMSTDRTLRQAIRLADGGWSPAALAGYLHAADPTLTAAGIVATLDVIPDAPPAAAPQPQTSGPKPRRHHAVVTANSDTDHDELPWLVSCTTCIEHAVYVDGRRSEPEGWDHTGEWKASDKATALQLAREHDARQARP